MEQIPHEDISELRRVWNLRHPAHAKRYFLYRANGAFSAPTVIHGETSPQAQHCGGGYLGCIDEWADAPEKPRLTIFASLPRDSDAVPEASLPGPDDVLAAATAEHTQTVAAIAARDTAHRWTPLPRKAGFADSPPPSAKPPALLVGMHWLNHGGAEKLAFDCIRWGIEAGLRVFVVAERPGPHPLAGRLPEGVTFVRFDRFLPQDQWPMALENLVRAENIRVMHIHHCVPLYAALPHLKMVLPDLRIVDSTHILEHADGGFPRISGVWSRFIDTHHVISENLRGVIEGFGAGGKTRLGRMVEPPPPRVPRPPRETGDFRLCFVGRLVQQKRPLLLVPILSALQQLPQDFTLDIVGEGPLRDALMQAAERAGVAGLIRLHPADADVPALLADCDALLLPSDNEGLALVAMEAADAGAIPITTDVGAQSEMLPPELLVPADPAETVRHTVRILSRLAEDPAHADDLRDRLHGRMAALRADPSARAVMSEIYSSSSSESPTVPMMPWWKRIASSISSK